VISGRAHKGSAIERAIQAGSLHGSQQTAEVLTALNRTGDAADFLARINQAIVQSLMIPFSMVVFQILTHRELRRLQVG